MKVANTTWTLVGIRWVTASAFFWIIATSHADASKIYRYVDQNGIIHFTDSPRHDKFELLREFLQDPKSHINIAIEAAANHFGLPTALLKAVVHVESDFDPQAVSRAGAMGLMQLMPQTASEMNVLDPFNVQQSIWGGAGYLKKMFLRFGQKDLALAAYNAGPSNVAKYAGIPPFPETQKYVSKVLSWEEKYMEQTLTQNMSGKE